MMVSPRCSSHHASGAPCGSHHASGAPSSCSSHHASGAPSSCSSHHASGAASSCSSHHASGAACSSSSSSSSFVTVLSLSLVVVLVAAPVGGQMALPLDCSGTCVCASDIISCSRSNLTVVPGNVPPYAAVLDLSYNAIARLRAEWTPVRLGRLHTLLLGNNGLHFLSSEAFAHVTELRHLDLSSNRIVRLDELLFEPLACLEVLLLYGNAISQIDRSAFSGLAALQRLYLSHNRISRFPLELVKERGRPAALRLLDLSSNRIKALPLGELRALPAWVRDELYFHDNAPACSCSLFELLERWRQQRLSSVSDFRSAHRCVLPGPEKEKVPVLELDRIGLNCSAAAAFPEREAFRDQFLLLDCDARQRHVKKTWFLPGNVPLASGNRSAAVMLPDGNLQIGPLRPEDSGVYTCVAAGDGFNETLQVSVAVLNGTGGLEGLKTAYTTLVACLVSVVMVMLYLYLTPCRCACCPGDGLEKGEGPDSEEEEEEEGEEEGPGGGGGGGFAYRHVGVPEAKEPEQNGRLNPIGEEDEEWPDGRERRRSDAESVCSDTPMVV